MTLYEEGSKNIDDQIELWDLIRRENILCYYGRKEGYKNFGLQPLPALMVCEYKAKEAIQQGILLKSLKQSPFGNEEWSLTDTSAEIVHTSPANTFKKHGFTVDVHFDNNPENSYPYTSWDSLYVQDEDDNWYKTTGKVDINGIYYEDKQGDKNYFTLFSADAQRYGTTGQWTVYYKNETLSTSASISSPDTLSGSVQGSAKVSSTTWNAPSTSKTTRRQEAEEGRPSSTTSSTPPKLRSGRRRGGPQQGEPRPKRRRAEETGFGVPAGQVGRRHTSLPRFGLTRLSRLEEEARDPPIILVKGCANTLKCWRNRYKKSNSLCLDISTVFRWAGSTTTHSLNQHRMLLAFKSTRQRDLFLATVPLPKGTSYALGSLDSL